MSGTSPCRACVVVPTYNHAPQVPAVLSGLERLPHPVVIVDDGSSDRLDRMVSPFLDRRRDWRFVKHARNRGKAAAIRTGMDVASDLGCTHVVTIDADGQLDTADVPRMLDESMEHPEALVLGVRPERISHCPRRCMLGRRYAGLAVFAQTGRRFGDTQCGLRVYPLSLFDAVSCRAGRYAFEAEIITRAVWADIPVREVDVACTYAPTDGRSSHFRPVLDSLRQGRLHAMLLLRALLPWRGAPRRQSGRVSPWYRRVLAWANPASCWRDLRDSDLGAMECGAALGLGVWIGTLPFFGLHAAIALYVAWRLHLRPAAVVLGTQVSIPPFGAALAIASIFLGKVVIGDWSVEPLGIAGRTLLAWLVGSIVLGFVLALATFALTQVLLPRMRRQGASSSRTERSPARERISSTSGTADAVTPASR